MRAFQNFRGLAKNNINIIWQPYDSLFPYQCSQCQRLFEKGGKRWLGSSMAMHKRNHHADAVLCDDCHGGLDPNRKPIPKLAERRTSLD